MLHEQGKVRDGWKAEEDRTVSPDRVVEAAWGEVLQVERLSWEHFLLGTRSYKQQTLCCDRARVGGHKDLVQQGSIQTSPGVGRLV